MNFKARSIAIFVILICILFVFANTINASEKVTEIPKFELPLLVTCTGQTPGYLTIYTLLSKLSITADSEPLITPRKMDTKVYKTMIVEMGASLKGLGAAGLNQEEEMKRCNSIFVKAKELGIKIIGTHTGGEARRNEIADKFITPFAFKCDYLIVLAEGNKDGLFNKIAEENKIPLLVVESFTELPQIFSTMFK